MAEKLDQSDNSFMKTLFFGEFREDLVFPYLKAQPETSETIQMILDSVSKFGEEKVKSSEWDEKGQMPREIVSELAQMGLLGLGVPEDEGGLGLTQSGYARIFQDIATLDASVAVTMGAHQSIGYKALLLFGTPEQRKKYLPRLASGELIACYCLTEPSSGSDAASIKTKAVLSPDGSHYVLTGNKLWITNAGIASFATVFAKTEVEDRGEKKEKVSCFILELPAEGVSIGPAEHKLGIRASWTNAVHFDNVKVPKENLIGELGKGFKVAMSVLNHGRLGLSAGCVGLSKKCLEHSILHAMEREQFKKKLSEFGMIQDKIGRMAANIYAAETVTYMTTSLIDRGNVDYSLESAIAKVFSSEILWNAVDENLQIWGGMGYMKEYPYERWLRDSRINRIFEGTNEILRAFIALSGMQGVGEDLSGLAKAIRYPLQGLGLVSDFAWKKIKRSFSHEKLSQVHPYLNKQTQLVEEFVSKFSDKVEGVLRKYGREVHLKQMAQKRIADIAIDLFVSISVLSRLTTRINAAGSIEKAKADPQVSMELTFGQTAVRMACRRIRTNLRQMDYNDDDGIKAICEKVFDQGKYPFDVILK